MPRARVPAGFNRRHVVDEALGDATVPDLLVTLHPALVKRCACSLARHARDGRVRAGSRDGHRAARGADLWSRLAQAGPRLLVLGSAFTAPLFTGGTLTLTGDRLLCLNGTG